MKQLIPLTDDGLFVDAKTGRIFCDSRFVARAFEKAAVSLSDQNNSGDIADRRDGAALSYAN
jgi:hypothetical protein